jgi:lipocalin
MGRHGGRSAKAFRHHAAMRRALVTILCCTALLAACGAGADAHAPPAAFDLDRYLGRWYVIARTAPGDGVGTWVEYRARDDGRIETR